MKLERKKGGYMNNTHSGLRTSQSRLEGLFRFRGGYRYYLVIGFKDGSGGWHLRITIIGNYQRQFAFLGQ